MTPQINREPGLDSNAQLGLHLAGAPHVIGDLHLTSDQMSDLLASAFSPKDGNPQIEPSAAEAHLRACAACTAEFTSLREALSLFQEATTAYSDREFARLRKQDRPAFPVLPAHRTYSHTLFWAAASVVLMAGLLPLEMRWQRTLSTPPAATAAASAHTAGATARTPESDEALLEDVDRELSASVPAPMQALADPTSDDASAASQDAGSQDYDQTSSQNPEQRKD
jgi:hypothetical protein